MWTTVWRGNDPAYDKQKGLYGCQCVHSTLLGAFWTEENKHNTIETRNPFFVERLKGYFFHERQDATHLLQVYYELRRGQIEVSSERKSRYSELKIAQEPASPNNLSAR